MYIGLRDWGGGGGYLTIIEETGVGAFANESCPLGQAFDQFFQMPGVCPDPVCPGGCSRFELTPS